MMTTQTLLATTFFGPVQWYAKMANDGKVLIESCENYTKQTYRNRCVIATANGTQTLTVPVERGTSESIRDIIISDHGNWRHIHRHALMSAYGDSPFFEFYADDIMPFFERRWKYLYDMNTDICRTVCELIDIHPDIQHTDKYIAAADIPPTIADYREAIRPKHPLPDDGFHPREYYQVYSQRHGFMPNMSILDLLFNMGPESIFVLKE